MNEEDDGAEETALADGDLRQVREGTLEALDRLLLREGLSFGNILHSDGFVLFAQGSRNRGDSSILEGMVADMQFGNHWHFWALQSKMKRTHRNELRRVAEAVATHLEGLQAQQRV